MWLVGQCFCYIYLRVFLQPIWFSVYVYWIFLSVCMLEVIFVCVCIGFDFICVLHVFLSDDVELFSVYVFIWICF